MGATGLPLILFYVLTSETMSEPLRRGIGGLRFSEDEVKLQRERLKAIVFGKRIDRMPVRSDLRWWVCEKINDGVFEEACLGLDIERALISGGFSSSTSQSQPFSVEIPNVTQEVIWSGPPVVYKNGGFPGSHRTVVLRTPVGDLNATESHASRSFGITDFAIKSVNDLKTVLYIYEQYAKIDNPNGEMALTAATPIQNFLLYMAGVEFGTYLLHDYKHEVESFMRDLEAIQAPDMELAAKLAGQGSKMTGSCENLSSDVSASYFEDYLGPQLKRRTDVSSKYGCIYRIHLDGKMSPLLGRLKEVGVGAVDGLTAMPSGDLEPEEIREAAGPDMILYDIIPQSVFMYEFDINVFEAYIRRVVEFYKNDHRVVLGIGDMLPAVGDMRRYITMLDIVEEITSTK